MHFVNMLNAKNAHIYQKNALIELGRCKKTKKIFTTTLYVVADSYNPFRVGRKCPWLKKNDLKMEDIMTILDKKMATATQLIL